MIDMIDYCIDRPITNYKYVCIYIYIYVKTAKMYKFTCFSFSYSIFQMVAGPYSFIPFIFIISLFGIFFFLKLPETKNKSYSAIYKEMGIEEVDDDNEEKEAVEDDESNMIYLVSEIYCTIIMCL